METRAPEISEEEKAILDERLKTADQDAEEARPWREVLAEIRINLKHPTPR